MSYNIVKSIDGHRTEEGIWVNAKMSALLDDIQKVLAKHDASIVGDFAIHIDSESTVRAFGHVDQAALSLHYVESIDDQRIVKRK